MRHTRILLSATVVEAMVSTSERSVSTTLTITLAMLLLRWWWLTVGSAGIERTTAAAATASSILSVCEATVRSSMSSEATTALVRTTVAHGVKRTTASIPTAIHAHRSASTSTHRITTTSTTKATSGTPKRELVRAGTTTTTTTTPLRECTRAHPNAAANST